MQQITFRLRPGELLKEKIEKTARTIGAGAILSLVGSLESVSLRMAGATPEQQQIKTFSGPFEIVSATGTLSLDGCHVHISVSDTDGRVIGGHLKEGTVATTIEAVIAVFADTVYKRAFDPATGFNELVSEE